MQGWSMGWGALASEPWSLRSVRRFPSSLPPHRSRIHICLWRLPLALCLAFPSLPHCGCHPLSCVGGRCLQSAPIFCFWRDLGVRKGKVEVRKMHSGASGWDKAVTLLTIVWPCGMHSAGNLAGGLQWTECLCLKSHILMVGSR